MLVFRYVLRHIFRNEGKEAGRGTQYIITRVQVRARLVRAKMSRKMRIFQPGSPGRSAKMMKTGRKISFPAREKHENYPDGKEKHVQNWAMESEKSEFFF